MSGLSLDWEARFRAERTPWERPTLHPAFTAWRTSGALSPCRILLPGAGRSGEPLVLARDGFDVTVVDAAPSAVAVQTVRFQAAGLRATVAAANLLTWNPAAVFDAVYDQACLCSLPPESVPAYAARLHAWLRPGGALFVLLMQTDGAGGPPFNCPPADMQALFKTGWTWPDVIPAPVPHPNGRGEIPVVLTRD